MTRALAVRERLVERAGERPKPTVTDLLTKISAVALMQNRAVNAHFAEDGIRRFPTADVGLGRRAAGSGRAGNPARGVAVRDRDRGGPRRPRFPRARQQAAPRGPGRRHVRSRTSACSASSSSSPCSSLSAGGDPRRRRHDREAGRPRRRDRRAANADADAHVRPSRHRRRGRGEVPRRSEVVPRGARPGAAGTVWYQVRDLDAARATATIGFTETYFDGQDNWSRLERNGSQIGARSRSRRRMGRSRTSRSRT